MAYNATKKDVSSMGAPPDAFLDELVAWGKTAAAEIFAPNSSTDIYSNVYGKLGPWKKDPNHRRAVMLEVMRVLAGLESSWDWNHGPNGQHKTEAENEAGAWQVSADSMEFGQELKDLAKARAGSLDAVDFQKFIKKDHTFAMEYIARLLRRTVDHNGPVRRHEIDRWLRKDAVEEFLSLL